MSMAHRILQYEAKEAERMQVSRFLSFEKCALNSCVSQKIREMMAKGHSLFASGGKETF
jgi:hypothetical protein